MCINYCFAQVEMINFEVKSKSNVMVDSQTKKDFVIIPASGFSKAELIKVIIPTFLRYTNSTKEFVYTDNEDNICISQCGFAVYYPMGADVERYNIKIHVENGKIKLYAPVLISTNKTPIPYNINRWFNREGEIGKTEIKYKEMQETTVNDILRMIFKEVLTKE